MKKAKTIFLIIFGNFLLAVSVKYFVLPYEVLSGGVAGIALILNEIWGINTTLSIDVLIILMFILGYFFLGKEFTVKTILSSAVYPVFITVLDLFPYQIEADSLLMAIYGGVIAGVGIGIVLEQDASTGGTDVPPLIVHKYTNLPIPVLFGITDGILVVAGLLAYGMQDVMIGLIYIFVSNYVINRIIMPKSSGAVALIIISDKLNEICDYIHSSLDRGTTIIAAKGGYTKIEREVVLTVVSKQQYHLLSEQVNVLDPYAFVIVSDAKDIAGEGFTYESRV